MAMSHSGVETRGSVSPPERDDRNRLPTQGKIGDLRRKPNTLGPV